MVNNKRYNIHVIKFQRKGGKNADVEKIFEKIMAGNFISLAKERLEKLNETETGLTQRNYV